MYEIRVDWLQVYNILLEVYYEICKQEKISKKSLETFKRNLKNSIVEKDVENAYRQILDETYKNTYIHVDSPYLCDGYYYGDMFTRLLFEAKYDEDFVNKNKKCNVLAQALAYMKKFKNDGMETPNVVLVGDRNECFVVSGMQLSPYLDYDTNWDTPPSDFGNQNPQLVADMVEDTGIASFTFNVFDKGFDFNDVFLTIQQLSMNEKIEKIPINEANIRRIFDSYLRTFFFDSKDKYKPNLLVSSFFRMITGDENCYINPSNSNQLNLISKEADGREIVNRINIYGPAFFSFFAQYKNNYSPSEKDKLNEIADRLLEEATRRFQGSYWTPTIWANRALEMLDKSLGSNWILEYIVWDACCGSLKFNKRQKFSWWTSLLLNFGTTRIRSWLSI